MRLKPSHQLLGLLGENNGGHAFLLATGARTIRVPDREAELLEHYDCSFKCPSVATESRTSASAKEQSERNAAFWERAKTGVRFCQIGSYLQGTRFGARLNVTMRWKSDLIGWFIERITAV
jgi:hypothetical protein